MPYINAMQVDPELFMQMLADGTRLRILVLLQAYEELCVCDLEVALSASQPKVSRHLGQLRAAGVVQGRRAGRWMYYRIAPDLPSWAASVLQALFVGLAPQPPYEQDARSLAKSPNRPGAACCP